MIHTHTHTHVHAHTYTHLHFWVVSIFWLLSMMLLLHWYEYLFESLLSVPLCLYPEVRLLGHWFFCLTFWGVTKLFPTAAASFDFPITSAQGVHFLHILVCAYLPFIFITILMSVKWRLTYISLMTKLTWNIFLCASLYLFLKAYSNPLLIL